MVVAAQTPSSPSPPPIGSLIDNGALELVEVLGYGGYGIVYRAIDTYTSHPTSYAVKCLPHSQKRSAARQRQLHIREITLHQLASAHPGVVTLHRVIEDYQYTWIVMDYCSDGDLFTQILHNRRYLGQNELIKEVFLQLLDAVEYCHSLNIYHRDLKPENVLCFDDGLRLAITDFGLATTDRMSTEFRTGSVYHMSPECQGAEFAPTKSYSPLFNDIWSLGIILLNLITGRNPWKSASPDDCTFQAYLKDPRHFLPTVLPISDEVNKLLVRTLEVDWRRRITLREMRLAVKSIKNFYSPDALFEDSMARCPWEAGVNMDDEEGVSDSTGEAEPEVEITEAQEFPSEKEFNSRWSHGSDSDMVFRGQPADDGYSWTNADSRDATCAAVSSTPSTSQSPSSMLFARRRFDSRTPSVPSNYSLVSSSPSIPSPPVTPGPEDTFFGGVSRRPARLTLDMEALQANYYDGSITMISARSSPMHTALESATQLDDFDPYSSFYVAPSEKTYAMTDASDDMGMLTDFDEEEAMDAASVYSFPEASTFNTFDMSEPMSARPESPVLGLSLGLPSSETTAVDSPSNWSTLPSCPPSEQQTPAYSFLTFATTPNSSARVPSFSILSPTPSPSPQAVGTTLGSFLALPYESQPVSADVSPSPYSRSRSRKSRLLNPMRLAFTRRSRSRSRSPSPPMPSIAHTRREFQAEPEKPMFQTHWTLSTSISPNQAHSCFATPAPLSQKAAAVGTGMSTSLPEKNTQGIRRRPVTKRLRSRRGWFSPGRLFAAVMPSSP